MPCSMQEDAGGRGTWSFEAALLTDSNDNDEATVVKVEDLLECIDSDGMCTLYASFRLRGPDDAEDCRVGSFDPVITRRF